MSTLVDQRLETRADANRGNELGYEQTSALGANVASLGEEQIRALVQRLFFRQNASVRHVGLVSPDVQTDTGALCFNIARVLAEGSGWRVAVIDGSPGSAELLTSKDRLGANRDMQGWKVGIRQWAIPIESWMRESESLVADQSLDRLRQISSEYDFTLLRCSSVDWLTSGVGHCCDGVVLVLTANKTRRMAAVQMRDQLRSAGVPVLGSVLTERTFPIPQGLYCKL